MSKEPKTLLEAVKYFSSADNCRGYIVSRRWPNGVTCPVCGAAVTCYLPSVGRYQCSKRHPKRQFTVKTGTVMEDSPLPLEKWLVATWLVCNAKNGISSYEIARAMGVTQKTAWFMLHRIRYSLQGEQGGKLMDHVEVDETYIGGKARNMHKHKREEKIKGRGSVGKAVVMGMLERGGKVVTKHIEAPDKATLQGHIKENVDTGAAVSTDAHKGYTGLSAEYRHGVVDPRGRLRRGQRPHERSGELLESPEKDHRRNLRLFGAVPPSPIPRRAGFPLQRAQGQRRGRLNSAIQGIAGRRLTYKQLTGWVSA